MAPWQGVRGGVYICSNTLALPIAETDDVVLSMVEGEVLGTRLVDDLLRLVDTGAAHAAENLTADAQRLRDEIDRLVGSIAAGVPADTVAPAIRTRETALARVVTQLRAPRPEPPDLERLRAALRQRSEQWKADLRAEPKIARMVLRRLVGPLTLWEEPRPEWCRWETTTNPAGLLDGLVASTYLVASPTGIGLLRGDAAHVAAHGVERKAARCPRVDIRRPQT